MDTKVENFFKVGYRLLDTDLQELPNLKLKDFSQSSEVAKNILKIFRSMKLVDFKRGVVLSRCSSDGTILATVDKSLLSKYLMKHDNYLDFLVKYSYLETDEIKKVLKEACSSQTGTLPVNEHQKEMFEKIVIGTNQSLIYLDVDIDGGRERDGTFYGHENHFVVIKNEKAFKDFIRSSKLNDILNEMERWKCAGCSSFLTELWNKDIKKHLADFKTKNFKICKKCKGKNYFRVYKNNRIKFFLKK